MKTFKCRVINAVGLKKKIVKRSNKCVVTHIRLRELHFPSMRTPASFSSGLAKSAKGGNDLLFRNSILSRWGDNDSVGSGGASTISLISGGGRRYPFPNVESAEM